MNTKTTEALLAAGLACALAASVAQPQASESSYEFERGYPLNFELISHHRNKPYLAHGSLISAVNVTSVAKCTDRLSAPPAAPVTPLRPPGCATTVSGYG